MSYRRAVRGAFGYMQFFDIPSERLSICEGCCLTAYQTDKFKTAVLKLSVALPSDNDPKNAALFSLMINLLKSGTEKYPEKSRIIKRLNDLYDASCSIGGYATGENRIFEISSEMLSDRFSSYESIFEGICEMMYQMLFCPVLDDKGRFVKDCVEKEKNTIIDRIKSEKNNSREYAFKKCRELMCEGTSYGVTVKPGVVKKLTQKQITDYYKKFVSDLNIHFSYVGEKSSSEVANILKKYFSGLTSYEKKDLIPLSLKEETALRYAEEEIDIKQGVLVIGMRTGILLNDEFSHVMSVFNNVYGGTYSSRLFKLIREKMSMCYYVSSDYVTTKGIMFVSCGIDVNNKDVVQKTIIEELEKMKLEKITDEELSVSKKLAIKELRDMTDYPNAIASFYYGRSIYAKNVKISELIEKISAVTTDDVLRVAQYIVPDTVFFLKGNGIGAEEESYE